jgi:hypothetical protein
MISCYKLPSFNQDRLGTTRGKALKKRAMRCFLQSTKPRRDGWAPSDLRSRFCIGWRRWRPTPRASVRETRPPPPPHTHTLSHFIILLETITLPRHARDKHGTMVGKYAACFAGGIGGKRYKDELDRLKDREAAEVRKRYFVSILFINCDHFTKTGSGQT